MIDYKGFMIDGLAHARLMMENFVADFWKLLKALGPWAVPFVVSYTILAIIPLIFAMNIGYLTDAIIGARGVGTMTGDVTNTLRTFIIVTFLGFAGYTFLSRFEGKARDIGQTFCDIVMVVCLFIYLLSLNWWTVAMLTVFLLPIRVILYKIRYLEYLFIVPPVLLFASCASKVINYAAIRAVTVGDAMSTIAASGFLAVVVCVLILKHNNGRSTTVAH